MNDSDNYYLEAIRSVPVGLDGSKDMAYVALPQSNLERRMVFAVQGMVHTISARISEFSVVYNV